MKEYIEREAVLERLAKVDMDTYYGFTAAVQFGVNHAIQCIKEAPAADVVEVVRCRECSHSQEYLDDELFCLCFEDVVPLYGYCYKGERKETDHEQ